MDHALPYKKEENKRKGLIISLMFHILLLLIALIPYLATEEIPKEISGIVVAFGIPEGGSSNANPISDNTESEANDAPSEESSNDNADVSKSTAQQKETTDASESNAPVKDVTPISHTSDIAAAEAQKEKARKEAEAAEAAEKQRQAQELARLEAQKAAEEKAKKAAFDDSKSKFSDLLGTGKGNNNNEGNAGDPEGNPDSDALNQIATGSGRIGGGLTDRGVLFEPEINDNSQYTGVVVVKVCVDNTGKVIEAKFTQLGSTTTNKTLVSIAESASKKYKFSPSDIKIQCGNITIDFKVK